MKKLKILFVSFILSAILALLCSCLPYGFFVTIGRNQPEDTFGKYCCQYNGNEYYIDENAVYESGQMLFEGKYMVYIATDGNYLCVSTFSPETPEYGVMIYDLNKRMLLSESQILPDGPYSSFVVHDGRIFYTQGKTLRYFDIEKMEMSEPDYEKNSLGSYDAKSEKELYIEISGNGLYIFGVNEEEFTHHLISRTDLS